MISIHEKEKGEREKEKCGVCTLPSGGKSGRAWDVWVTGMNWKLPEVMLQTRSPFQEPWLEMLEEGPQCLLPGLGKNKQEGMLEEGVAHCSGHTLEG